MITAAARFYQNARPPSDGQEINPRRYVESAYLADDVPATPELRAAAAVELARRAAK